MNDPTLDLLTAADPARDVPVPLGDVETLLRRASGDVTGYDVTMPVRHRRRALIGVAAAVVVAVTGAVVLNRAPAGPDTPPPLAPPGTAASSAPAGCLDRIADGMGPAPYDTAKGAYEYLRTRSLSGSIFVTQDGRFATASYEVETSTWTAADGSQRRRVVVPQPTFPDETSEAYFRAHPDRGMKVGTRVEDVPAGEAGRVDVFAAMTAIFRQSAEGDPSRTLAGAADLVGSRVLDASQRATLLRFLARTNGVTCTGTLTDPVGRTGVAVTAPMDAGPSPSPGDRPARLLVVDPATGEILASGVTDTGGTTWDAVHLERGFTDSRPATTG
ncbi:hypothetical protein Daura_29735 [Dactylosporangium aurantiacum]|uniref:CU044_5270 family protein n=1 Tax=Dactylosporangium aurantiacum TaxID=35754 RepID=A0A9Q9I7X2_9ACTN|nr:hypothetical protein [Dactylosporangium aurantiacum]MDG6106835.1 hypothetical protein [Dactylosporangium aurantiacum]UWZ50972.1 hypothetical protein Daura_29735 [Dactylosporangium aurantiacum]